MGLARRRIHSIVAVSVTVAPYPVEARVAEAPVESPWVEELPDRQIDPSVPTAVPWSKRAPPEPSPRVFAGQRPAWYDAEQRPQVPPTAPPEEPPKAPPDGVGLLIGGGATSFGGAVALIGGIALRARYEAREPEPPDPAECGEPCAGLDLPQLRGTIAIGVGVGALIVGPVLLGLGGHVYRSRKKLRPRVQRSLHGTWTAGLMLEF